MLRVARTPSAVAYKAYVVAELALTTGLTVVDIGCGPGTDLSAVAEMVGPDGLIVGVDLEQTMLIAAASRVPPGVALIAADAHSLPLTSGSVDRVRIDRALQHMIDPRAVLADLVRVLRPGGLAVIAEPDWRTLVIDGADAEVSERFVDYTCREVVRNAVIGREVARLGTEAGFITADVMAFPAVLRDFAAADKIFGLTRNAHAAADAGYLDRTAADSWRADLSTGCMLAAVTLFVTTLLRQRDQGALGRSLP
jgi:SAM-dependent methyltransferase